MKQLLTQLLWKGKNKWQILGAAVGTFIGFLLLLLAVQFYQDLQTLLYGNKGSEEGYIIVNKKVNLLNTIGGASGFTEDEITNLKKQTFVNDMGRFKSNQFKAAVTSQRIGFYSEMFLEALPDRFIDVKSRKWKWKREGDEVPLILSRDYLALYNFGFAPSQGHPQFTPNTITRFPFTMIITGQNAAKRFRARIIGFSDRINSILVPQDFLEYANANYGNGISTRTSRLILQTDNPYDKNMIQYLEDNKFEISTGKLIGEQVRIVLNIVISVIGLIGGIIVFLSFLVFILNFQLMIAESSHDIRLLLQIGYRHDVISQILIRHLSLLFGGVVLATLLMLFIIRYFFVTFISNQGFELSLSLGIWTYGVAILFIALFFGLNWKSIQNRVKVLGLV